MTEAFLVDGVRTPIGRYGGALAAVRPDDLAAHVLRALVDRLPSVDWSAVDDVVLGCANQAGEDNRNVARMALLLAGLPETVSGTTVNRLCGSGADAVAIAARAVRAGEADLVVAGGVESMSRAPFVMAKAQSAYDRTVAVHDSTLGWRFVNPEMERLYGIDAMGETAENVAEERVGVAGRPGRVRAAVAGAHGEGGRRPAGWPRRSCRCRCRPGAGDPTVVSARRAPAADDPRGAGRAEAGVPRRRHGDGGQLVGGQRRCGRAAGRVGEGGRALRADAAGRVTGGATAGVAPRVMGLGPVPATRKLLDRAGVAVGDIDVVELNEAFAAQALAVLRDLGLPDDAEHVNPNGGAIALGHPLGMSGARLALTCARSSSPTATPGGGSRRCASASARASRCCWSARRRYQAVTSAHASPGRAAAVRTEHRHHERLGQPAVRPGAAEARGRAVPERHADDDPPAPAGDAVGPAGRHGRAVDDVAQPGQRAGGCRPGRAAAEPGGRALAPAADDGRGQGRPAGLGGGGPAGAADPGHATVSTSTTPCRTP